MEVIAPDLELQGTPVRVGRRMLTVAPLTIGPYRRLVPHLEALKTDPANLEHLEAVFLAAHQAIARNHPDVTLEQLDEEMDLDALLRVVQAMCGMPVIDRPKEA